MIPTDLAKRFPWASGYLNTASIGLPPQAVVDAMRAAIDDWQAGAVQAPDYDVYVDRSREAFAGLVAAPVERVAVGAQASPLVGLAATALEPGSRVLAAEGEFTSVIFPFLVRDDVDIQVETVPLGQLADAVRPDIDMVAFSAVQSSTGEVADMVAITESARANDALTLVDATQAAGWLPLVATDFDFLVVSAYKWLLSPRGSAFMTVSDKALERTRPLYAGWYAGESPWESIYGMPLRLAQDARRLDISPGWLAWVGTAAALDLISEVGVNAIHAHNVGLANSLLAALDMAPTDSAIISLDLSTDFDTERLAGLSTAYRAGRLRVGFHLYNTPVDVAKVVSALKS